MTTVGLPKGLFYFEHGIMWEQFFKNLGCEVVLSCDTNKRILDNGVRHCSNETCLPVKVFHGHVLDLKDRVDYIFIPRYSSKRKKEYTCPKFCGLPDMTVINLRRQVNVLEVKINEEERPYETEESLKAVARTLNIKPAKVLEAFNEAFESFSQNTMDLDNVNKGDKVQNGSRIALSLLGHPYMIYDGYLSMRLVEKLNKRNIDVYTPRDIDHETKRNNAYPFQGKIFWDIGFELLGSAFTYADDDRIKGIIYLTPFACGIDAFIMEFIENRIKSHHRNIPILKLTVDEHTGEAGFDTRLEAFIDMIG